MKQILLTQGKYALVDDEDYEYLMQRKWHARRDISGVWYAEHNYQNENKKIAKLAMHRVIMNAKKGQRIDHKDGNGLNNQRYNLREATNSQNLANRGKTKINTSGYKGVYLKDKWLGKYPWRARIKVKEKLINIGQYATAVEAAMAYDQAAKEYFGEFAKLNF